MVFSFVWLRYLKPNANKRRKKMAIDKQRCLDIAVKIADSYASHSYSGTAGQKEDPATILESVYKKVVELSEDVYKG
jgi:hypothetical protein